MIVAPYRDFPFLVPTTFHEFLTTVQRAFLDVAPPVSTSSRVPGYGHRGAQDKSRPHRTPTSNFAPKPETDLSMVSISLSLHDGGSSSPSLSPLHALELFAQPDEQHFYWEKQDVGDAIAAVGCLAERQLSGSDRFVQAQEILDKWFAATAIIGELQHAFTGLHGFCRFTFFEQQAAGQCSKENPDGEPEAAPCPFPPASVFIPKWHLGQHHDQTVFVANIVDYGPPKQPTQKASTLEEGTLPIPGLERQCADLWQIYQLLKQPLGTSTAKAQRTSRQKSFNRRSHFVLNPSSLVSSAAGVGTMGMVTPERQVQDIGHETATRDLEVPGCSTSTMLSLPIHEAFSPNPLDSDSDVSALDSTAAPFSGAVAPLDGSIECWSDTKAFRLSQVQKDAFKQSVETALEVIESTPLNKVVLAQVLDVTVNTPFQVFPSLHNLHRSHGDCHVFSTANGKGQVFIGASPERLLSIRDRTLYTEAIAGSAPRGETSETDDQLGNTLLCSLKELHEHQLVVNYITQQLSQLNLEPQRSPFPKLLQLPNIQHLHTPIFAELPPELNALEIVGHLHPTPAVAGVPQDMACELIQEQEPFERSLYAAPIGWVNHRGDSEFIVGIRSALLDGHTSRLYAGAGIVRGSQPELEVSEIELKLQALLTNLLF